MRKKEKEEFEILVLTLLIGFLAVLFLLSGAFKLCDMIC
jgi:hypothetical protein